jgi:tRNA pseudouridine synthase 10
MEENSILNAVKEIIQTYKVCPECLGRQFALLGTNLTNSLRAFTFLNFIFMQTHSEIAIQDQSGDIEKTEKLYELLKKVALNGKHIPSMKYLIQKEIIEENLSENFICSLCNNIFLKIDDIVEKIIEKIEGFEFKDFLLGSVIEPRIQDREDEFRARHDISAGEAFKRNLNRVVGIKLGRIWDKPVEFNTPELNIYIKIKNNDFKIEIQSNPLCIQGRYRKYERGIPQTHWPHRSCRGKGCKECDFTGKQYQTSVEELISPYIQKYAKGSSSKFHGAGREDIDARCLGDGRPFIVEIKDPHTRTIPLKKIEKDIQSEIGTRVDAINLELVPRSQIKELKGKGEKTSKTYLILVESDADLEEDKFQLKMKDVHEQLNGKIIYQRTPIRVVHRRADKTREKKIYEIHGKWIDSRHFQFKIKSIGGTYIKELASGDTGRTTPSLTGILGVGLKCVELDVLEITS